jgi:serine/threonine-protein kinase
MARVYLGLHEEFGRPVAVKRLRPQLANAPHARERLLAEARIMSGVHHDNVARVLDVVSQPSGESYYVMEHLAGEPLADRVARTGALPLSEALSIGLQVASAVEAVHRRGVVHRDLKTENVLVTLDRSGRLRAVLIDFGVAEVLGEGHSLVGSQVVGTPESMAPEQVSGRPIDYRCDIYSFGVLLYEMVTGAAPFTGMDVGRILRRVVEEAPMPPSQARGAERHFVPPALDELILACLAKNPGERPQRMSELRRRLEEIAAWGTEIAEGIDRALEEEEGPSGVVELVRPAAAAEAEAEAAAVVESASDRIGAAEARRDRRAADSDAWFAEGEELALDPWGERLGFASPTASRRLGHAAAAALLVAAIAAGLLGLMGYTLWSPAELEILWAR